MDCGLFEFPFTFESLHVRSESWGAGQGDGESAERVEFAHCFILFGFEVYGFFLILPARAG